MATVDALAACSANIVIADLNQENGTDKVQQLQANGTDALFVRTNVGDANDVASLIDQTLEKFGSLKVLREEASVTDEKTGLTFYRATVEITDKEFGRLGGRALIPGMPVEVLVPTNERTVLSYLIKPLADHLSHALREE